MTTLALRPILFVLGIMLSVLSVFMLIAAVVDLSFENPDWHAFVAAAAVTAFVGGTWVAATWQAASLRLRRREAFVLVTSCWIALPAFSALPLLGQGHGFTDAFFEAVSAFTTTGSTVFVGLDAMAPGILFWRSLMQWLGGVGIVVMAVFILPFLRVGGMQLFETESLTRAEKLFPSAGQLARWILVVYTAMTVACTALYRLAEMTTFDALNHAMATLSTGGFSTHDASFDHFDRPLTQWIGVIFMLAGALPFVAIIKSVRGEPRALITDPQIRTFLLFLVAATAAMSLWLRLYDRIDLDEALRLSAFNIVSVVTTTGFAATDYQVWGPFAVAAFFILTFVGGCTGSTSGAVKVYRHQVLWMTMRAQLLRLSSPHRAVVVTYDGRTLPADVPASVLAFVALFVGSVTLATLVLALLGLDLVTALSSAATALCNVGPGLGPIVGPAGNFATLPDAAKWVLAAVMLLGRLEIMAFLVLLDPQFWRS
ncbi:MAG: TrkH family potassium uptake protein [Geminicoccaceae bacterium]|nr:TrkH family potassium uptake protein [Geminicoccaceae bacterium]